jgi:hypothetical protein
MPSAAARKPKKNKDGEDGEYGEGDKFAEPWTIYSNLTPEDELSETLTENQKVTGYLRLLGLAWVESKCFKTSCLAFPT